MSRQCDICTKTNTYNGNQELWSELDYWKRQGITRRKDKIDICLNCLNKIENLIDELKSERNRIAGCEHIYEPYTPSVYSASFAKCTKCGFIK